jgi:threonine/homoserine/homoserine lactone efflux protein
MNLIMVNGRSQLVRIFCTGLFISFLGTLPLGVLNVAAAQLAVNTGMIAAFSFSLGALLVEMGYVRLSLVAMDWVRRRKQLFRWLEWGTVIIVLILAITSFAAAYHPNGSSSGSWVLGAGIYTSPALCFAAGMALSALNPLQIPFWFGWSTVLITRGTLLPRPDHYNSYIAGIGLGTFVGNAVFILGGSILVKCVDTNQHLLNTVIGGIFLITAIIQAGRILTRKNAL